MILTIDSDAAYQVAAKSRSQASGYHYYLGNLDGKLFNGAIFILAKIIKAVMQSAAEAECGGRRIPGETDIFITCRGGAR
jgi:hypothetical protein